MVLYEFAGAAILGYLAAFGLIVWSMRRASDTRNGREPSTRGAFLVSAGIAVAGHVGVLAEPLLRGMSPSFSFLSALSLVTLSINCILLVATLLRPVEKLAVITFPLAVVILLLKLIYPEEARVVSNHSWQMATHISASLLAYSFLNIAAIQAVLLAIQDACLRSRHPDGFLVRSLPSLQSMETLMFQLIGAGFVLLTISLVSGFVFLENMFAQHLAHKTVLSLLAWLVFAILLVGRIRFGWRGQFAIRWTLAGFVALMLAYFGSKMVLELILNRT